MDYSLSDGVLRRTQTSILALEFSSGVTQLWSSSGLNLIIRIEIKEGKKDLFLS